MLPIELVERIYDIAVQDNRTRVVDVDFVYAHRSIVAQFPRVVHSIFERLQISDDARDERGELWTVLRYCAWALAFDARTSYAAWIARYKTCPRRERKLAALAKITTHGAPMIMNSRGEPLNDCDWALVWSHATPYFYMTNVDKRLMFEWNDDSAFVSRCVRSNGNLLAIASDRLKADRTIVLEAVTQNGDVLYRIASHFSYDIEIVRAATATAWYVIGTTVPLSFLKDPIVSDHVKNGSKRMRLFCDEVLGDL